MDWHDLRARWSGAQAGQEADAAAFETMDGARTLIVAPGTLAAVDPMWLSFRLRKAHPFDQPIIPTQAPYLLAVRVRASDQDRDEFRRWLDEEHCRRQVALPNVRWFLGYEQAGPDHSFLNLWGLDDPEVVSGRAWISARDTPWWKRISHVPANSDRGVYRRVRGIE